MTAINRPVILRPVFRRAIVIPTLMIGAHLIALPSLAQDQLLPVNPNVIAGDVAISRPTATSMQVDQASQHGIINWDGFSIGAGHGVAFNNGDGATLNRVVGNNLSEINGSLSATGSLYLINQNGVIFGENGIVRTGQDFVVSTLNVADSDFLSGGDTSFTGDGAGFVLNLGEISSLGGDVALISKTVRNRGLISAENGTVGLIAGRDVLMRDGSLNDGKFLVRLGGADTEVEEAGIIRAAAAELRANGGNIYALAGNTQGSVQASGLAKSGGRIFLTAGNNGSVKLHKKLSAKNGRDGGKVLVTGGTIDMTSLIDASGLDKGGLAILYAEADTRFSGQILTFGDRSEGNGGFIEVSGRKQLSFDGQIDTGGGTLLLDPQNVEILDQSGEIGAALNNASVISPDQITNALVTSDVVIHTSGDAEDAGTIYVRMDVDYTSDNDLTLLAHGDIVVDASIRNSGATSGDVNLIAGWDGATGGARTAPNLDTTQTFDVTAFDGSDVDTQTAFGNDTGAQYTIFGEGTAASGSVLMKKFATYDATTIGSRSGTTRVYGNEIDMRGDGYYGGESGYDYGYFYYDDSPSQIGFVPDETQSGLTISGDIMVEAASALRIEADGQGSHAQIGHIGATSSEGGALSANATGDITVNSSLIIQLAPGGLDAYAMIGHGSANPGSFSQSSGLRQGDVTVRSNFLSMLEGEPISIDEGGTTVSALSWLGHATAPESTINNSDFRLETGGINPNESGLTSLRSDFVNSAWQAGDVNIVIGNSIELNESFAGTLPEGADLPEGASFANDLLIQSFGGDITIGTQGSVSTTGTGDITLAAAGNLYDDTGEGNAIIVENGRYAIYSSAPDVETNLADWADIEDVEFDVTFTNDGVDNDAESSGNVLAYAVAPTLSYTASNQNFGYGGSLNTTAVSRQVLEGETVANIVDYAFILDDFGASVAFGSGVTFSTGGFANAGTYEGGAAVNPFQSTNAATGVSVVTNDGDLTISPADLFVLGADPFIKVYDGETDVSANINSYVDSNVLNGDVVSGTLTGVFDTKNVGIEKTVSQITAVLSGPDASNYRAFAGGGEGPLEDLGSITPRLLGVEVSAQNKAYDGTTDATLTYSDDRITGDALTFSTTGQFADKNVGTDKEVTIGEINLSGTDAANYTLSSNATASAEIFRRELAIQMSANSKTYDGTTVGTASFEASPLEGDDVTVSGAGAFEDKNVGNEKTVSATDLVLSGDDAENYFTGDGIQSAANINPRAINIFVTAEDKEYDGTSDATVSLEDDRVEGDEISVSGIAAFEDENVGTDKRVNILDFSLSGADASNYEITLEEDATADITPRELLLIATAEDKIYDGTTQAITNIFTDELEEDDVSVSGVGAFDNKNAGTEKTVTISGITLSGADAANYTAAASAQTSADIDPRLLSLTVSGQDRIFDGTTDVDLDVRDDRIEGDDITVTATGSFEDADPGQNKPVTVTSYSVTGPDAGNYQASEPNNRTQASIAPAETPEAARPQPQINERAPDPVAPPSVTEPGFGVYSDVATDALVRDLVAASEFCRQIGESEYVIDCLGDRLAEIASRLPSTGAYAESREALEIASRKLEALVRENASAALPPLRIATRSISGGGSQNRVLRAVEAANIASVTEQAVAILQEAETVLLRAAENSQRRRVHYQRIATAVGSNKVLLRST